MGIPFVFDPKLFVSKIFKTRNFESKGKGKFFRPIWLLLHEFIWPWIGPIICVIQITGKCGSYR